MLVKNLKVRINSTKTRTYTVTSYSVARLGCAAGLQGCYTRAAAIIVVAVEEESRRIRENYRTPRKYIVGLSG